MKARSMSLFQFRLLDAIISVFVLALIMFVNTRPKKVLACGEHELKLDQTTGKSLERVWILSDEEYGYPEAFYIESRLLGLGEWQENINFCGCRNANGKYLSTLKAQSAISKYTIVERASNINPTYQIIWSNLILCILNFLLMPIITLFILNKIRGWKNKSH